MLDYFLVFYFFSFLLTKRKKFPGHHLPLLIDHYIESIKECSECWGCIESGESNYYCNISGRRWHRKCMARSSKLVNHPLHPNHVLKLLLDGAPGYTDGKCHFCRVEIQKLVYHCATCDFSLDVRCGDFPPSVMIDESKCHNHPLTLMALQVSFVCQACGMHGERNPYVCVGCSFMVHLDCINLPHIININRHDHRIFHTYSLGPGNRICGVCRMNLDWRYGAYSCSKCPNFFVHSGCATRLDLWDGKELDGVPEEEEDEPMFKMIEDGVINHVKHPFHNLRLTDDAVQCDKSVRCQLCEGLVISDKFYNCMECDYILHETCAYLPKRKRLGFAPSPLLLKEFVKETSYEGYFKCEVCKRLSTGYMYYNQSSDGSGCIDLRCAAVDWSYDHECHPHTLFLTTVKDDFCGACKTSQDFVLRCVECEFLLCYKCATYPKQIKHRCDEHPLVLSFGNIEQHGIQWCTVCEARVDHKLWFYECEECGIVCHIHCAIGDFANVKPGLHTTKDGKRKGMVLSDGSTRPHCSLCLNRCLAPFMNRQSDEYFCSLACSKEQYPEWLPAMLAKSKFRLY